LQNLKKEKEMVDLKIKLPEGFLDEEVRQGYTITTEMKKIWAVELDLLQRFLEACEKHGLKCYADAGTLLGTVRDKGFIPWDDDIDLVMFRDDYDKMVEIAPTEFEEPYFFQNYYSDENYPRGHAQFRNSNTTGILTSDLEKKFTFNQGIFIDIFVLDGVDDNKLALKKAEKKISLLKKCTNYLTGYREPENFHEKLLLKTLKLFNVNYKNLFKKVDDELRKHSISEYENAAPLNFVFETKKRIRNKHIYDSVTYLPFEFMTIPAPERYDEFLSVRYGDYMKPAQISTTHGGVIFDVDKSYTEYQK
jgi:phosphorylcholine metabolism protein LicD